MPEIQLKSELTLFDVTNLVVGAIIGADVYVASAFGAGILGPASLLAWVVAGVMAVVIALCFAQCAALLITLGLAMIGVGIPIYVKYTPKKEIAELKQELLSRDSRLKRAASQEERFLAHLLWHVKQLWRSREKKQSA